MPLFSKQINEHVCFENVTPNNKKQKKLPGNRDLRVAHRLSSNRRQRQIGSQWHLPAVPRKRRRHARDHTARQCQLPAGLSHRDQLPSVQGRAVGNRRQPVPKNRLRQPIPHLQRHRFRKWRNQCGNQLPTSLLNRRHRLKPRRRVCHHSLRRPRYELLLQLRPGYPHRQRQEGTTPLFRAKPPEPSG